MKPNTYWNLLLKRNKFLKPASLTFSNIKAVIQAFFRKQQRKMTIDGFTLPLHIYEQIIWRRTQVMENSPECWRLQTCRVCGCDILGKTMEDRSCSAPDINQKACYPAMMNEEEWASYKINNNIKLFE